MERETHGLGRRNSLPGCQNLAAGREYMAGKWKNTWLVFAAAPTPPPSAQEADALFAAVGDPVRRRILLFLADGKPRTARGAEGQHEPRSEIARLNPITTAASS